jgi:hypothetical protein
MNRSTKPEVAHPNMGASDLDLMRARMLVQRLGRLSADSIWAHRASGVRASLDKFLTRLEAGLADSDQLAPLLQRGTEILEKAAQTIPSPDEN